MKFRLESGGVFRKILSLNLVSEPHIGTMGSGREIMARTTPPVDDS